jgi:HlyD family secretion protein
VRHYKVKWKKRWLVIPSILLLLIFAANDEEGIEVSVTEAVTGSISETIPSYGKVKPVSEVRISPDVSGEIVEVFCMEGDAVSKGDLLLKIKPDIYISVLDQARAALNVAHAQYSQQEANLHQAKLHKERSALLIKKGAISQSDYEEAESACFIAEQALKSARFSIQSARASVREAEENLAKTSIYSPMDGTVSRLMVEKGERVVGTSQMAGTEMLRIADLSNMEIVVEVNENDILKVECGDTAIVEIDAIKGSKLKGVVTNIANSAKNLGYVREQVTSFEVNILILGETTTLRPGMSASATILTDKKDDIILIPLRCINSNGCIFVVRNDGSSVQMRRVRTGIQDINMIETADGLKEGEIVVEGPYEAINNILTDNGKIHFDRDQH